LEKRPTTPHLKKPVCYVYFYRVLELVGFSECGNKPSGSAKGGEFLD